MELTFASHAGFVTKTKSGSIFTDPWLKGKAFNESWSLLSPPYIPNFEEIDYIFVTHEHPDHFSFPTLKSIPAEIRQNITILYQYHASPRMLQAFYGLGFQKVIELPLYKWIKLNNTVDLYCGSVGSMDSFLAIKEGDEIILNLNDCVLNTAQYTYIKKQVGEINILLTQFSFANWVGNDSDEIGQAAKKIEDIKLQQSIFKPKYTIPFASFVYFCNAENARMNAWANTPLYIDSLGLENTFFMYPKDTISVKNPVFNPNAVALYQKDIAAIKIDSTPAAKSLIEIENAVKESMSFFKQKIPFFLRNKCADITIFLTDINEKIVIQPKTGEFKILNKEASCRLEMCSQMCWFTFKFGWGGGTLAVSGMYRDNEAAKPLSRYFFFQNLLSTEFINLTSINGFWRTFRFFWAKKGELFYRFKK